MIAVWLPPFHRDREREREKVSRQDLLSRRIRNDKTVLQRCSGKNATKR